MASDREFVTCVVEQMRQAGAITSRKVFGEYAIYCDQKVVALVCDNQLFVKPTGAGRALPKSTPKSKPKVKPNLKPKPTVRSSRSKPSARRS